MGRWISDVMAVIPPMLAYTVVGVLATAESLFLGLVLPGELVLVLGGLLAYHGRASLTVMLVLAGAGSVGGYLLAYAIGRRYGPALRTSRLGRRIGPDRWAVVDKALVHRGARAILFGRLVGVLRAVMPLAAGMARMRLRTFVIYATVGGLIWGPGSVLLGYFAGGSYQKVVAVTGPAGLVVVILLVLIGVITATARWIAKHPDRLRALAGRVIDRPRVVGLRRRYRRQLAFIARRFSRGGALGLSLTSGLVVIGLAGWAFGSILGDVVHRDELAVRDSPVAAWLTGHRAGWLTAVMRVVTMLGSGRVTVVALVLALLLLARPGRRWHTAILFTLVAGGTSVLVDAIKLLTTRTRPDIADLLTAAPGYAFPSGHSAQAAAVYGVIAYLLAGRLRRWGHRVSVWTAAVLIASLVGFSRLYLGAHWLTDVLGGLALGTAWSALVATTLGIVELPTISRAAGPVPPAIPPPARLPDTPVRRTAPGLRPRPGSSLRRLTRRHQHR
ncbi:bifunctional DedA family/phosphatase PAP2 family protein [Paractinoplanes hotanensis]|uniref:Bifunctional DedA family/phosphatase PAP2 family protein n=1 Tax=Paractinoplanes hotanensis TaxID=2906497 RepID=A0ABT0YE97_9ACTN|nr:bifunctional DedA family/phosphatase PAP2 family protein [Actinoplanes hotanensis]MCM4084353.1 bifunctional DedA family/phosphatase PAP2 family protein [Actinoplanes hotanensis]